MASPLGAEQPGGGGTLSSVCLKLSCFTIKRH